MIVSLFKWLCVSNDISRQLCDGLIKWHAHRTRRTIGTIETGRSHHSSPDFSEETIVTAKNEMWQREKEESHINCVSGASAGARQKIESKLQSFASLISICRCCSRYAPLSVDTLFSIHFTLLSVCVGFFDSLLRLVNRARRIKQRTLLSVKWT